MENISRLSQFRRNCTTPILITKLSRLKTSFQTLLSNHSDFLNSVHTGGANPWMRNQPIVGPLR